MLKCCHQCLDIFILLIISHVSSRSSSDMCVFYYKLHNAALGEMSHLDDVCVTPVVRTLRNVTINN